jgi:SET domain-containing protein
MYLVTVKVKKSSIDGKGVFAKEDISKGTVVWKYTEGHDKKMSVEEFGELSDTSKKLLQRIAYLSETSGKWVIPPQNDPACFTNHDQNPNTTVVFDPQISEEPIFIANRTIQKDEEITNSYLEFDMNTQQKSHSWL